MIDIQDAIRQHMKRRIGCAIMLICLPTAMFFPFVVGVYVSIRFLEWVGLL